MDTLVEHSLLHEIKKLQHSLEKLQRSVDAGREKRQLPHSSETVSELFSALSKAQAEMSIAGLNNENPYFKSRYADLAAIVKASRPALSKNGLCVIQNIVQDDDGTSMMHTKLCHASGEWIESRVRIVPPKNDIQTLGSYITYLRRYSYSSLVGMVASGDDDDGEIAMVSSREILAKGPSNKYNPKEESSSVITSEQLEELNYELAEYPDIAEEVMDKLRLQSLADMPKSKFMPSIKRIREIKTAREGN